VEQLVLQEQHWNQVCAHLQSCLPEEGSGLLAGHIAADAACCDLVVAVHNILHSPVKFRMSPQEQYRAFCRFEEDGLELLAIYHSHPTGPARPSPTDLAEFAYPGVYSLICAPLDGIWTGRAFRIEAERASEVMLTIS
jgi:proteasome lid subunit RPN8/RPN11